MENRIGTKLRTHSQTKNIRQPLVRLFFAPHVGQILALSLSWHPHSLQSIKATFTSIYGAKIRYRAAECETDYETVKRQDFRGFLGLSKLTTYETCRAKLSCIFKRRTIPGGRELHWLQTYHWQVEIRPHLCD
jgi:hypothetical protein